MRDLNDGRTTATSFLGVRFGTDSGGAHLDSTIFSGELWDIREDLGAALTDEIVCKALTEYLTPLDGFTQGRDAVLAAAAATGTRVIWLDSTTGISHVVTRARPAGRCEAAPRSAAAAMP